MARSKSVFNLLFMKTIWDYKLPSPGKSVIAWVQPERGSVVFSALLLQPEGASVTQGRGVETGSLWWSAPSCPSLKQRPSASASSVGVSVSQGRGGHEAPRAHSVDAGSGQRHRDSRGQC